MLPPLPRPHLAATTIYLLLCSLQGFGAGALTTWETYQKIVENVVTPQNYTKLESCGGAGVLQWIELPCSNPQKGCKQWITSERYYAKTFNILFTPAQDLAVWDRRMEVTVESPTKKKSVDQTTRLSKLCKNANINDDRCPSNNLQILMANETHKLQYTYDFGGSFAGDSGPIQVQLVVRDAQNGVALCLKFPIEIVTTNGTRVGDRCSEAGLACNFYDSTCQPEDLDGPNVCRCSFGDYADPVTCRRLVDLRCDDEDDCTESAICAKVEGKDWERECQCGFWDQSSARRTCEKNLAIVIPTILGCAFALLLLVFGAVKIHRRKHYRNGAQRLPQHNLGL